MHILVLVYLASNVTPSSRALAMGEGQSTLLSFVLAEQSRLLPILSNALTCVLGVFLERGRDERTLDEGIDAPSL